MQILIPTTPILVLSPLSAGWTMGKMSRNKGKRGEYEVRDILRDLGWSAHRVPMSGAAQGFKHDVIAEKDTKKLSFEVKLRKASFSKLYVLLDTLGEGETLSFLHDGVLVDMTYNLGTLLGEKNNQAYVSYKYHLEKFPELKKHFQRVMSVDSLRQGADFLAVRDNSKPFIFIRYL